MSTENISYKPSWGLSYDPSEPKYWDEAALKEEVTRTFEVCSGCRMCFKFCESFPRLFDLLDNSHEGDVRKLEAGQVDAIMDDCFQCKLCEVQCPYTPRDNHEFLLDFPKLVHRYKAIRAKKTGFSLRDQVLGNPDMAGQAARLSFGLANTMNRVRLHRLFMEKTLGIHRDKLLPDFASSTFESWAESQGKMRKEPKAEVVLFQTCYVQNNEPQIGRDTLEVLEKNQVDACCARGLQCCGMPKWEHGDLDGLREQAKRNLDILMPYVENGAKVLAINPTCSMMLRKEYPELVAPEDKERAQRLAEAVRDPSEFLWSIRSEERFNTNFQSSPGRVAYHTPCHLRVQAVGFRASNLMKKIPGVEVSMVQECCGHDGTYAMTVEGFDASARVGKRSFDQMKAPEAEVWTTDCPLAAVQFEQHAGKRPLHPMTVLARAYRAGGFDRKAEK